MTSGIDLIVFCLQNQICLELKLVMDTWSVAQQVAECRVQQAILLKVQSIDCVIIDCTHLPCTSNRNLVITEREREEGTKRERERERGVREGRRE